MNRDIGKHREWQRQSARRYEDRLREGGASRFRSLGRNRERQKKRRERDFGDKAAWVATLPCCACGAPPPSDPHHHPTRAAGGTARDLVALCRPCHNSYHNTGAESFARMFEIDLVAEAEKTDKRWRGR